MNLKSNILSSIALATTSIIFVNVGMVTNNSINIKSSLPNNISSSMTSIVDNRTINNVSPVFQGILRRFSAGLSPIGINKTANVAWGGGGSGNNNGGNPAFNNIFITSGDGGESDGTPTTGSTTTLPTISSVISSGYIATVTANEAFTYSGDVLDNHSRPTVTPLPKGTVDHVSSSNVKLQYADGSQDNFRLLGSDVRVFPNQISIKKGSLPSGNKLNIVSTKNKGRFTTILLNTNWKAPFSVQLGGQDYINPFPSSAANPNYAINSATYKYVDINFSYATSVSGNVNLNGCPIFSSSKWILNNGSSTLRLVLKNQGSFYGWSAYYNNNGQLQFSFLHPAKVANNSLKGTVIMLDPGHGGKDTGALPNNNDINNSEAVLNLNLSNDLKNMLVAKGATVIMTRTDNSTVSLNDRNDLVMKYQPDIFISIHHNASSNTAATGYADYYYEPYSANLAKNVYSQTSGVFSVGRNANFYPYQVTRVTNCPSILTENGFMTNDSEFSSLCTQQTTDNIAYATVQGIQNYFNSIK